VIGYPLARVGRSAPIKVPVQGRKLASVEAYGDVCFSKSSFQEIIFKIFWCLFAIRKVGQRKTLSDQ
jgi:hypothetical protein